jgi:hypothetical protein
MRLGWGVAALVLVAAFAVGFALARSLAPGRLRERAEVQLGEALGGPVAIGRFEVALGLAPRLRAAELTAWPEAEGPRLRVERAEASLRPLALLTGGPPLGSLRLDGVQLEIAHTRRGEWSPPPFAKLAASREKAEPAPPAAEPWLAPVMALEQLARGLLEGPGLANRIEIHRASLHLSDQRPPGAGRVSLVLEGLEASLRRHRILGGAELFARGRLLEDGAPRGTLELLGSRARGGRVELALAATSLDLAALAPYLERRQPPPPLAGQLSGYLGFQSAAPGEALLELDLVLAGLRSLLPAFPGEAARPLDLARIDLAGFLELSPRELRLRDAHIENQSLSLELSGRIARPLARRSAAALSLALGGLEVHELRDLLSWLPEVRREQAARALTRLEAGRLAHLQVTGEAPLAGWQEFLAGRTRELPEDFALEADLAETRIRVGDDDHLEELSGHLDWRGDQLEVAGARANLDGHPLPVLDLRLEGVSSFLAGDPERRRLAPGGEPLRGLDALFEVMKGDPEKPSPPVETRIRVEIEALDHPALLWPLDRVEAEIALEGDDFRVEGLRGTWAGVPITGRFQFEREPERRARVELVASPPDPTPAPPRSAASGWAHGRFEVDRLVTRHWSHEHGRGRFRARAARFDFEDVEASFAPTGRIRGTASLDFAQAGGVPYRASFLVEDGDVSGIAGQLGLPADFATGQIELAGSFQGRLVPRVHGSQGLTGLLSARARDGVIRRVLPAVTALALASSSFNPFTGREQIRYDNAETVLEFEDGGMRTNAFSIDGPDLRVFASGTLSLASPSHEVDADVVLFLFRQIDNVIGKIPVLNLLLLGTNENLLAAYYDLTGPWADPEAQLVPLRSFNTGPANLVLEGVPLLLRKSLQAIGALDPEAGVAPARPFSPEPPPPQDS